MNMFLSRCLLFAVFSFLFASLFISVSLFLVKKKKNRFVPLKLAVDGAKQMHLMIHYAAN